jgi:hypothetical protein
MRRQKEEAKAGAFAYAWRTIITSHRPESRRLMLQLLNSRNFSETWSWRWLSGRLRKFNKIEAKSIGAFA